MLLNERTSPLPSRVWAIASKLLAFRLAVALSLGCRRRPSVIIQSSERCNQTPEYRYDTAIRIKLGCFFFALARLATSYQFIMSCRMIPHRVFSCVTQGKIRARGLNLQYRHRYVRVMEMGKQFSGISSVIQSTVSGFPVASSTQSRTEHESLAD